MNPRKNQILLDRIISGLEATLYAINDEKINMAYFEIREIETIESVKSQLERAKERIVDIANDYQGKE